MMQGSYVYIRKDTTKLDKGFTMIHSIHLRTYHGKKHENDWITDLFLSIASLLTKNTILLMVQNSGKLTC